VAAVRLSPVDDDLVGVLVLLFELADELSHLGVPTVECLLHIVSDLRRIGRLVDVVVAPVFVVDLLFPYEANRTESLDEPVRGRPLSMAETLEELSDMNLLQSLEVSDIVELLAAVERYLNGVKSYREEEKAEIERTIAALESLPVFSF
jgi:hypothetical protein